MFMLGFILFCAAPSLNGYIWLHIFHVPRGITGFLLMHKLPTSHDIVAKIQIPNATDGSHYSMEGLSDLLKKSVSQIFLKYIQDCRKLLLGYGVFTFLSLTLDLIEFLIHYIRFGYRGDEHSDLTMLLLTLIFLGIDSFYIAWTFQAKGKFPGEISATVTKALYGYVDTMNQ